MKSNNKIGEYFYSTNRIKESLIKNKDKLLKYQQNKNKLIIQINEELISIKNSYENLPLLIKKDEKINEKVLSLNKYQEEEIK